MSRTNLALLARSTVALGLAVAILAALQLVRTRQLQEQSAEMARFNVKRQALVSLLAESLQYGQKNPAINPILSAAGLSIVPEANSIPAGTTSVVANPGRKPPAR